MKGRGLVILTIFTYALAGKGTLVTQPVSGWQGFDRFIYALMDSALCDTGYYQDQDGIGYKVYTDSLGLVWLQIDDSYGLQELKKVSPRKGCSSPVVFEMRMPGKEPKLVVMWREEIKGKVEVLCRLIYGGYWSDPMVVTIRED